MKNPYTFIFVGRSGSGKGTQIDLLKKYIQSHNKESGNYSLVMGDIFRSFMKNDGHAQNKIKEITRSGNLVPDLITNSLFASKLLNDFNVEDNLYIDGIPRSVSQTDAVVEMCKFYDRLNPIVVNIEVGAEEAKKRMLLRSRADDTDEAISSRLKYYEEHVVPAVEYLQEKDGLTYWEINGERPIEEIHEDIISRLNEIA